MKITLPKRAISSLATALCVVAAFATDVFVPKPVKGYLNTPISSTRQETRYFMDMFEFPDDVPTDTNFDENDEVEASCDISNPELASVTLSYYAYMKKYQAIIKILPNTVGVCDINFNVTYKGETYTATMHLETRNIVANTDKLHADLIQPTDLDVLDNDMLLDWRTKKDATLSVVEQPSNGTLEPVIGKTQDGESRAMLRFTPNSGLENYTNDSFKYKVDYNGDSDEGIATLYIHKNAFSSRVIEFKPAPGQFTNESGWSRPADQIDPIGDSASVSLGGFGGYIIYGFEQPIKNNPKNPYGVDFQVAGNSFIANVKGVWSEPGAVMVMKDLNDDGLPNDGEWYELAGSDYWLDSSHRNIEMTYFNPAYNKRYTIPWETNNGLKGALLSNQFHNHSYYPDPYVFTNVGRDQETYSGTLIQSSLDKRVPSYIEFMRCPAFGYADNKGHDKTDDYGLTYAHNPYTELYDCFDISWAVDKDGNYVDLDEIDFVKVYCAGAVNAGWLGEWSTEVFGVGIITPDPEWEQKDYYLNYIGLNQIQVCMGKTLQYQGLFFKNGRLIKDGIEAEWSVDDPEIGTIDQNGLFTPLKLGTTNVRLKSNLDAEEDSVTVEVVELGAVAVDIEGMASTVSNKEISCLLGETIFINVESETTNEEVINGRKSSRYIYDTYTWQNSNPTVGEIDNGLFTSAKVGETNLTVASNIDPSLTAEIKVMVKEDPANEVREEVFVVGHDKNPGNYTDEQLFDNGISKTTYLSEIVEGENAKYFSIENNKLVYDFGEDNFGTFPVQVEAELCGNKATYDLVFEYLLDMEATPKAVVYTVDGLLNATGIDENGIYTIVEPGFNGKVLSKGSFLYVIGENTLLRVNAVTHEVVASAQLETEGQHPAVICDGHVLVADGNTLRQFYLTDLEEARTREFDAPIVSLSNNTYVNVATIKDGSTTFTELYSYSLQNTSSQKIGTIPVEYDGIIGAYSTSRYIGAILPSEEDAEPMFFDFTKKANLEKIPESFTVPYLYNDYANKTLYAAYQNGFKAFSYQTSAGQLNDGILFQGDSAPIAMSISKDGKDVAVAYVDGALLHFYYDGEELVSEQLSYDDGADLSLMTFKDATTRNNAPHFVPAKFKKVVSVMEGVQNSSSYSMSGTSADNEDKSMVMLSRIPEEYQDLIDPVLHVSGSPSVYLRIPPLVEEATDVVIPMEVIDSHGLSEITEVHMFTVNPHIVAPTINNDIELRLENGEDFEQSYPLTDFFTDDKNVATEITRTYRLGDMSGLENEGVTIEIDETGEYLVVKGSAGSTASGSFEIEDNMTHSKYAPKHADGKTYKATVYLTVDKATGVDTLAADYEGAEFYTLDGVRVNHANLVPGIYIVRRMDGSVVKLFIR